MSWASGSTKTSTSMDLPAPRHSGSRMTGERGRSQQPLMDGINSLCLHIEVNFISATSTGYSWSWWHVGESTRQLKRCQVQHFTNVNSHKRWVVCRYNILKLSYCTTYFVLTDTSQSFFIMQERDIECLHDLQTVSDELLIQRVNMHYRFD